jgi:predicted Co/Zn/Cd cation transporter (cation efflux family)
MFLDLDSNVQFLGSSGSASPLVSTQLKPWLSAAKMRLALFFAFVRTFAYVVSVG